MTHTCLPYTLDDCIIAKMPNTATSNYILLTVKPVACLKYIIQPSLHCVDLEIMSKLTKLQKSFPTRKFYRIAMYSIL